jgi:hypothetical protein
MLTVLDLTGEPFRCTARGTTGQKECPLVLYLLQGKAKFWFPVAVVAEGWRLHHAVSHHQINRHD